ncbi:hypothetical protein [Thermofilum pendens]|uniref:Uncharacterized protein n=1 Tax=Thermofilum pendens (strain DSM 2475 / Hrk 5) TaxID=368408 RepID=A1RZ15_THEPD|nr:hypothetical protein [Thermofilum pendens]ABL78445.1 hypothetical protein Tpen_1045 [Thermofilum pendens Hrk 5]
MSRVSRVNLEKLRSFTSKTGLYSWEEREGRVTVTFSSVALEEVLGENAEIKISGFKEGEDLVVDRVVIVRGGQREEVDPKVLEGWLRYIEQSEKRGVT